MVASRPSSSGGPAFEFPGRSICATAGLACVENVPHGSVGAPNLVPGQTLEGTTFSTGKLEL